MQTLGEEQMIIVTQPKAGMVDERQPSHRPPQKTPATELQ